MMPDAGCRMPDGKTAKGGYEKLEIYQLAHSLAVDIHAMSLTLVPIEKFEEAPQIRRSSKRVSASIVEGYAFRKYKEQFLLYLYRALGSSDETREHLELLWKTKSLKNEKTYRNLAPQVEKLSRMIPSFIGGVERGHEARRLVSSGIRNPGSGIAVEEDF